MLPIVNLIAVITVTAVVIYHYVVFSNTDKALSKKIEDTSMQTQADINAVKKETASSIVSTKQQVDVNLKKNMDSTNKALTSTQQQVNDRVNTTQQQLTKRVNDAETNFGKTMDNYFKTMSEQVTTKEVNTDRIALGKGTSLKEFSDPSFPMMAATNADGSALTNIAAKSFVSTGVNVYGGNTIMSKSTTDDARVGKLRLGDKFVMSGVGEAHGNDDWLRILDKNGEDYRGVAVKNLWTRDNAWLNGQTDLTGTTNSHGTFNTRGGKSEHNPGNWWTHLPWNGDNKNYIRGDTEIRGNTDNIGDMAVGRDINMKNGTIKFVKGDPGAMVEKSYGKPNDRYGMGQFQNGATRMYAGDHYKPASVNLSLAKQDGSFNDVVKVTTDGNTRLTTGALTLDGYPHIYAGNRIHVNGEQELYVLNKRGMVIGREWGGNGELAVQGKTHHGSSVVMNNQPVVLRNDGDNNHILQHTSAVDGPELTGCQGGRLVTRCGGESVPLRWQKDKVFVANELCVGDVCINKDQLAKIKQTAQV